VVLTGSNDPEELAAVRQLLPQLPAGSLSVAGQCALPQVACLLSSARLYVGPDTITTHMAAALGTPTIALFGPSNPVKWGPWPRGAHTDRSPFRMRGSQRAGNVVLLQGEGACVPCMQDGCDRHLRSPSACLQQLTAETVIEAARRLLDIPRRAASLD
jgi:heptosyltransferase III